MALFRWLGGENLEEVKALRFEEKSLLESDLERALAEEPDALGEELFIVARQFGRFEGSSRKIDLLALDRDGNLVVVELKRTQDAGHAELQAIRYAAMVSNLTQDDLIRAYSEYSKKEWEEARTDIEGHLESDASKINTDRPRIVIASAGFSKELATSVLWLVQNFALDITCVELTLYDAGAEMLLYTNKIIPLPQMKDYVVGIQRKSAQKRETDLVRRLRSFLTQRSTIKLMTDASDCEKPAVEPLQEPLLEQFGRAVEENTIKRLIGRMIRQVLRDSDYELAGTTAPVEKKILFDQGALYRRRVPPGTDETSVTERA